MKREPKVMAKSLDSSRYTQTHVIIGFRRTLTIYLLGLTEKDWTDSRSIRYFLNRYALSRRVQ